MCRPVRNTCMVMPSLEAALELEKEGFSVGVVNCRFVKPLDEKLVKYGRSAGKVLIVEENIRQGGLAGAILEGFSDSGVSDLLVRRLGLPDAFVEHGSVDMLRHQCGLDKEGILKEARALCQIGRAVSSPMVG